MTGKLFKIVALGAVLLHLSDGLLASLGHSHGPCDEHRACHQTAERAGHHHHHGECAGHDHYANDEPEEHEHSLPGHDDADHCAACRHLAQAAAHQFALAELPTVEKVVPLGSLLELASLSRSVHDFQSRGPPATAL